MGIKQVRGLGVNSLVACRVYECSLFFSCRHDCDGNRVAGPHSALHAAAAYAEEGPKTRSGTAGARGTTWSPQVTWRLPVRLVLLMTWVPVSC
jgi:hypothetical protein